MAPDFLNNEEFESNSLHRANYNSKSVYEQLIFLPTTSVLINRILFTNRNRRCLTNIHNYLKSLANGNFLKIMLNKSSF